VRAGGRGAGRGEGAGGAPPEAVFLDSVTGIGYNVFVNVLVAARSRGSGRLQRFFCGSGGCDG